MKEKHIKRVVQSVLDVPGDAIKNIVATNAGITNESFFITINDEDFIVRLPGTGTEELVDRKAEEASLIYGTSIGLNPETIYFNAQTGIKITRKIEHAQMLTPEKAREGKIMKRLIQTFQTLHQANNEMTHIFNPFTQIKYYESLIKDTGIEIHEDVKQLRNDYLHLREQYEASSIEIVPCHIDPVAENILLDGQEAIHLIDWEYSGSFDPMWDLATLFQSLQLTEEEEKFFLTHYFEREPTEDELKRLLLNKIFFNYMWSFWYFYKEVKGETYEDMLHESWRERVDLVKGYIETFKSLYAEDTVG
ncbi:MAG TPA: choline kinase family protein [Bacillota bacterium]|nr:choline kinase family protein [Bacillota bacterium]